MAVNFSVVGIYYNTTVDLSNVNGNTVGDIIQYLYATDPVFYYSSVIYDNKQIINMLGALYTDEQTSRSRTSYEAGKYFLTQTFDTTPVQNPYTVWQYYILDQNKTVVPVPNQESYTTFQVQDGWSIIWRLVSILNGPIEMARRLKAFEAKIESAATGKP